MTHPTEATARVRQLYAAEELIRHQLRRLFALRVQHPIDIDHPEFALRLLQLQIDTQVQLNDVCHERTKLEERLEEWYEEERRFQEDRFRYEDGDHHEERAERMPEHDYPG